MSQEKRPQVYPLLPQNDAPMHSFGNEPVSEGSQVIALQPSTTNETIPNTGTVVNFTMD